MMVKTLHTARSFDLLLNGQWINLNATNEQAAIAEANKYYPRAGDRIEDNDNRIIHRYGKKSGHHHRSDRGPARRNRRKHEYPTRLNDLRAALAIGE